MLPPDGGFDHCRTWDGVAAALRDEYDVIAPDLRGHGDSEWSTDGNYAPAGLAQDLATLIDGVATGPVTIVAHSYGGNIASRYAAAFPEKVERLVAIEGLGLPPSPDDASLPGPVDALRAWIEERRQIGTRTPRRYASIDEAVARMQEANVRLGDDEARHLTIHGLRRDGDGRYRWKYDNYFRSHWAADVRSDTLRAFWRRITCPTLLIHGVESWDTNPATDGRIAHFQDARVASIDEAGHWVHHDQLDIVVAVVRAFLESAPVASHRDRAQPSYAGSAQ